MDIIKLMHGELHIDFIQTIMFICVVNGRRDDERKRIIKQQLGENFF